MVENPQYRGEWEGGGRGKDVVCEGRRRRM